jgi:predicted nucleotidyltransferase
MRIFELDTNIPYHRELCPAIWNGGVLDEEVRDNLLEIAKLFYGSLKVDGLVVTDIIMTGSLANYNWSKYSDIDLHLVVDLSQYKDVEVILKDYFGSKKLVWNKDHDINIHGHEVELYVQDKDEPHHSTGIYSVLNDQWVEKPSIRKPDIDRELVKKKVKSLIDVIDSVDGKCSDLEEIERIKLKLKNMRQAGLDREGEFSTENLVFKVLRNNGYIDNLYTKYNQAIDDCFSI